MNCLGSGLKCQVCSLVDEGDGACSDDDDNGQSMECEVGLDVCLYFTGTVNTRKKFKD